MAPSSKPQLPAAKRLGLPLTTLIWLLIAASALAIYRESEGFIGNVFSVLLLFVFAAMIAVVLTPIVDTLQRLAPLRTHRTLTVLILYACLIAAIVGLGILTVPSLISQVQEIPQLTSRAQDVLNGWGIAVNLDSLRKSLTGTNVSSQLGIVGGVIGTTTSVILVAVISVYLLIDGRAVVATLRNLFPDHTRVFDFVVLAVGSTTEAYVRGQALLSLLIGTYTTVTLAALGVHYAILLGLLTALLELIPLLGSVISLGLAAGIAFMQSVSLGIAVVVVGLIGHSLVAYVIGPRVIGRVTQLHPLVAMSALLVGAQVGGVLGALFGVPIAATANIALGAAYRSRQGEAPLTTHARGRIKTDALPRLGDEIAIVDHDGVVSDPVPRDPGAS